MSGSSKASQFWDADAPFASASLVEMQKSPGLEGPLENVGYSGYILIRIPLFYYRCRNYHHPLLTILVHFPNKVIAVLNNYYFKQTTSILSHFFL